MDTVDKATRSRIMASVKGKNTGIELKVFRILRANGIAFRKHYRQVSGTPDIAFPKLKIAVFIDGDFWHGYRYPAWRWKIKSRFWREKIETNRSRDRRNFAKLRRDGWLVLRIWGHEVNDSPSKVTSRILAAIEGRAGNCVGGEGTITCRITCSEFSP